MTATIIIITMITTMITTIANCRLWRALKIVCPRFPSPSSKPEEEAEGSEWRTSPTAMTKRLLLLLLMMMKMVVKMKKRMMMMRLATSQGRFLPTHSPTHKEDLAAVLQKLVVLRRC